MNGKILISVAVILLSACASKLRPSTSKVDDLVFAKQIEELELSVGGRIGVSAYDTASGKHFQYRADERFPMCSTFKSIVVAAILRKSESETFFLKKHIVYGQKDVRQAGYSPITKKYVGKGMSIADLCKATIQHSDNTAVNLLVKELGGLDAVNSFARAIGDEQFRLDRWEPELNSAIPEDLRDTTTPSAMERSLNKILLGEVLTLPMRDQFQTWLKGNTTGDERIRAGVPDGWIVGDKTGTCSYGTANDVGIIWPKDGSPVTVAIFYTQSKKQALPKSDAVASVTKILAGHILKAL